MKTRKIMIILIAMLTVTACGKNDKVQESKPIEISRFEKDSNTTHNAWTVELQESEESTEDKRQQGNSNTDQSIGELTIIDNEESSEEQKLTEENTVSESNTEQTTESESEAEESAVSENETNQSSEANEITEITEGSDGSKESVNISYKIEGNDIIYNNKTYQNLYSNINLIESKSPYKVNTLIKFILYAYDTKENTIYTRVETTGSSEDEYEIGFSEMLYDDSEKYREICDKYSKQAEWKLELYNYGMKNTSSMVGCEDFVLLIGVDKDIEVDVTKFK